jgi:SOS-response transcriptional repressor LexA
MIFKDWLLSEITKRDWGVTRLALETGVKPASASRWVSGKETPSAANCDKIAKVLRIDKDFVLQLAGHINKEYMVKESPKPYITEQIRGALYDLLEIPRLGRCPAGNFALQELHPEGYEILSRSRLGVMSKVENLFIVKICGNSLIGDGINDGDDVVVDRGATFADGKIYIIRVDDECVARHVFRKGSNGILVASNHEYPDLEIEQGQIVGRVLMSMLLKYH